METLLPCSCEKRLNVSLSGRTRIFAAAEGAIGIAKTANKVRKDPLRVILNGLGKRCCLYNIAHKRVYSGRDKIRLLHRGT